MENKYNNYDNPSSSMRVNKKQLKHILMLTDYLISKTDTPIQIKAVAVELKLRTDKYCLANYNKVYTEIDHIQRTDLERFI
jgi:hypothetical protein